MKKLVSALLFAILLVAPTAAEQWGFWDYGPGAFGDQAWKEPVANSAALPATGNEIGDVRVTLDDLAAHVWDGDSWEAWSGGGGGVSDGDKGDIVVSGSGASWVVDSDSVALGTDTTGNYAGSSSEGGAATTALALAANGANCSAGQYPLGVDASGAAESCTADGPLTYAASVSAGGPATTATALAADPSDCAANQFANAIAASGNLTCAAIADADVPDNITVSLAASATALAANGANCSAGQYPLGVDASGAAESCTADDDLPDADEVTESMLKAVDAAADEECLTYESTTGDFEWQTCGSAGLGGTTGSTDDAILIADGVGGATVAASAATLTAAGTVTIPNGQGLTFGTRGRIGASGTDRIDIYDSVGATGSSAIYSNRFAAHDASFYLSASYLAGKSGFTIQWSDNSSIWSANLKLALTRAADGVLRVTDGANGTLGIGAILSSVLVEANTAGSGTPNAIAATESGTVFTNEGATAKAYQTLPSAVAGYKFTFIVMDADGLRITAAAGDDIRIGATTSTTAGYCESTTIGDSVTLVSANAATFVAVSLVGSGWTCAIFFPAFRVRRRLRELLAANDNTEQERRVA